MAEIFQPPGETLDPQTQLLQQLLEKNRWLIRARWFYPFFVLLFLCTFRWLSGAAAIDLRSILLVFSLPLIGNIIFSLDVRKKVGKAEKQLPDDSLLTYAAFQMDFDLVVLALNVFFSGGLNSPLLPLFIFYIMVSTFLTDRRKALRNTLTAIGLIAAIVLVQNQDLYFSSGQIVTILTWDVLLLFTFTISGYFSARLHRNEELNQRLLVHAHALSIKDGLTGLYNQAHFFELLDLEVRRAQRYGAMFSLIMLDVDYFKQYNDRHGHIEGSAALQRISQIMKRTFRASDMMAKYGGDEFVILLHQTDKTGAYLAAERLRENVEKEPFAGGATQPLGRVTISLGIASYPEHGQNGEEIIEKADSAMYQAKETGRNCTQTYNEGQALKK